VITNPSNASQIGQLRFITCGSADDGKSTLIGRLLRDSKLLHDDQAAAPPRASNKQGIQDNNPDFTLIADGLQPELEQGLGIDVAYRFFSTERRKFVVADTAGHEQYTRNMAAGASTADVAVIVIDARKGVLTQTRRHSRITRLFGIRDVIVAVNKMDLVGWDQGVYDGVLKSYTEFSSELGFTQVQFIPVSALHGDNVVARSSNSPWYSGPTLLDFLERVIPDARHDTASFRMAVQSVDRPNQAFSGVSGQIAAGTVSRGDRIRILPSGKETIVKSIDTAAGHLPTAAVGQSVTLMLEDDINVSCGDVVCSPSDPLEIADQFEADVLWMSEHALVGGRQYSAKIHMQTSGASITQIKYRVDVSSGGRLAARTVELNEIAVVNVSFDRPVPFEPHDKNRILGGFILIDRLTGDTVGAGMMHFALRRAANIHWQAITVDSAARAELKAQSARCFWFSGLPASGKSTIANLLDKRLHAAGFHTFLLDGDNVRHGLSRDLGFTEADRVENNRRVAEVARLMVDAGLIVIVSFISPFRSERAFARRLFAEGQFVEIFVDTTLEVCEARDPKGLYAKARSGNLKNFTGIDSPHEAPETPDFWVKTAECTADEAADKLARLAMKRLAN